VVQCWCSILSAQSWYMMTNHSYMQEIKWTSHVVVYVRVVGELWVEWVWDDLGQGKHHFNEKSSSCKKLHQLSVAQVMGCIVWRHFMCSSRIICYTRRIYENWDHYRQVNIIAVTKTAYIAGKFLMLHEIKKFPKRNFIGLRTKSHKI
jgi:hypothetical protein